MKFQTIRNGRLGEQQPWHHNADTLDKKVVHALARSLHLTDSKVRDEILSRKTNSITATYHSLVKRKESGQGLPYSAGDLAAEKWPKVAGHSATDSTVTRLKKQTQCAEQAETSSQQIKVIQSNRAAQPSDAGVLYSQYEMKAVNNRYKPDEQADCSGTEQPPRYENSFTPAYSETWSAKSENKYKQADIDASPIMHEDSTLDLLEESDRFNSYKTYLQELRKQKKKLYKGVLKRMDRIANYTADSNYMSVTVANSENATTNNMPMGDGVKTGLVSTPSIKQETSSISIIKRGKSASAKSVRFDGVAEDDMEVVRSPPDSKLLSSRVTATAGVARSRKSNRASSVSDSGSLDRSRRDFLLMARLRSKRESQVHSQQQQQNDGYRKVMESMRHTASLSPPVPPNSVSQRRPFSSVSECKSSTTSGRYTFSPRSGHHGRLKVRDDHSDKVLAWDLTMLDLQMAGEKIYDMKKAHTLPEIEVTEASTIKLAGKLPPSVYRHYIKVMPSASIPRSQIETLAIINKKYTQEEKEISLTKEVSTSDYVPRRHRYSNLSALPFPVSRDKYLDTDSKRQLHVHIPT